MSNVGNEKNYTTHEEAENNPHLGGAGGRNFFAAKFLHKTKTN
jgi:hypothetical protein